MKKIIFIICLILLIPTIFFICYLFDDKDFCLDTSICKEGQEINTKYGLIKINKESCEKHHWKWDEEAKSCNMRQE